MTPERKKLIDRITKLLALAESTSHSAEAESARAMAADLMAKHDIEHAEATMDESFIEQHDETPFRNLVAWHSYLSSAIARLNGVYFLNVRGSQRNKARYVLFGKPSDISAYRYMVEVVLRQRTEAWLSYKAGGGLDGQRAFSHGFALGVCSKVRDLMTAAEAVMRGYGMLVPISPQKQAESYYKSLGKKVSVGRGTSARSSAAGISAGKAVSLNRGVSSSGGTVLRIGRG